MGIFNFLKKDQHAYPVTPVPLAAIQEEALPPIPENIFVENGTPIPAESESAVLPAGDHNISFLFTFLDKNHEAKGYDDALMNPDSSNLSHNLDALQNEMERTIRKVMIFYEDFIQEIDFHILTRARSGMIDLVEELEMKKRIALSHIEKIKVIETSTRNNEGECKGILISYTRGFKNGLAAISHHSILNKQL